MVMDHPVHMQVFHRNEAKGVDDATALLMGEVLTLPPGTLMDPGHHLALVLSLLRALLCFSELALRSGQRFLTAAKEARVVNFLPIRKRRKRLESYVYSYLRGSVRKFLRFTLDREGHVPFPCGRTMHRAGLDLALDRAVIDHFDAANLGEAHPAVMRKGKATLRIGETVITAFALEAGVSRLLTSFDAAKEGFESQIDTNRHVLQDLRMHLFKRGTFLLQYLERVDLLIAGQTLARLLIGGFAHLEQMVIEPAALFNRVTQQSFLLLRREDSIRKHLMHAHIVA